MACKLDNESVNMPSHSCETKVFRAVCMATSSALMMVRVSSVPAASIYMVVAVGTWTTAAPSLGCPSMSEPSVYTQFSGMNLGNHWCVTGGGSPLVGGRIVCVPVNGGIVANLGSACEEVYPSVVVASVAIWAVTGSVKAVRTESPWPCLRGGVEGPVCGDCVPMAGIWGRERGGHAVSLGDAVGLG